jgi:hypothetical protein
VIFAPAPRDSELCLPLQLPLLINSSSSSSSRWRLHAAFTFSRFICAVLFY